MRLAPHDSGSNAPSVETRAPPPGGGARFNYRDSFACRLDPPMGSRHGRGSCPAESRAGASRSAPGTSSEARRPGLLAPGRACPFAPCRYRRPGRGRIAIRRELTWGASCP